jgi:hypothetical protein
MRPSDTQQGQRWVENFRLDERRAATLLIDSLRVISSSRFRIVMSSALRSAIDDLHGPLGVYPARELPRKMHLGPLYPLDHPYADTPGSEGIVGNIIRDVVGRRPKLRHAAAYSTLDALKRWKVRTLLLVDDYSGSGDQLVKYVDAWANHPTIKSWHSYGLLRINVLTMAMSMTALQRLRQHKFVQEVQYVELGGDFGSVAWTVEERKSVENLCLRYAFKREYALGYNNACGLLVLHHTVPNNLPCVLWQAECPKLPGWVPLFAERVMSPQQQDELDDYRLETDAKRIAHVIHQVQLGEALEVQQDPTLRIFLLVLGALQLGYRDPVKLEALLGLTRESTLRTLDACRGLQLIDADNRLTDAGRAELRRARTRTKAIQSWVARSGSDAPYYPVALRGADDV